MYYVYFHTRNDTNRPFYVGKGKGRRAWETRYRNKHWQNVANKHGWNVVIFVDNLTEEKAFEIERILIATIGRSNLTNGTDGGEGMSGYIMPSAVKAKIARAHVGMKASEQTRRKLGDHRRGTKAAPETRAKVSGSLIGNQRNRDITKRVFYHRQHGQFVGNMRDFFMAFGEHPTKLIKGIKLHIKGWFYVGSI